MGGEEEGGGVGLHLGCVELGWFFFFFVLFCFVFVLFCFVLFWGEEKKKIF